MGEGYVHYEHPFTTPPGKRTAPRRFRGRLASPVTIWTSGPARDRTGLTISSAIVADGEPARIAGLLNDTTELFEAISESERFIVHIVDVEGKLIADRFAGLRPSPGGLFADIEVEDGDWGPAITRFHNRAYCKRVDVAVAGYQRLIVGEIERFDLEDLDEPLVYFRGSYRSLPPR